MEEEEGGQLAFAEEETPGRESGVSEPTEEPEEEVADLGPMEEEESGQLAFAEEETAGRESGVSEPTEEPEEEVADLGPIDEESEQLAYAEEQTPASERGVSEPTEEPEEEVADLGPIQEDSERQSYAEETTPGRDSGVSAPQQFAEAEAEKPAEPARTAQAQPAQSTQAARPQAITVEFEAEPLFSFDRFNIRADQRRKLDELVGQLKRTTYETVMVVGHADRIGTEPYNQKLSERRAASVKAYLVRKGVPANKIAAEGRGKTEPITKSEDCPQKTRKALIVCYVPDRRVEVTVSAQKKN
jgi:outer membrane protein OmpA-like peptidoglycan-associated protein